MEDLQSQIEQLRANRAKQREDTEEEIFSLPKEKPPKKDDGLVGMFTFQAIVAVIIAILYVGVSSVWPLAAKTAVETISEKCETDFSFRDSLYHTVGSFLTFLNEVEPVEAESKINEPESNIDTNADVESNIDAKKDTESKANTSSDKSDEEANANVSSNEKNSSDVSSTSSEAAVNASTKPEVTLANKKNLPDNVTLAPVIYTGSIKFPLNVKVRVTSPFGFREHPNSTEEEFHNGVDIAADKGTPIKACADGKVIQSSIGKTFGKYIMIEHSNGFVTVYAHCDKLIAKEGAMIRQGEVIAKVGSTGDSTGNHLHLAMKKDGVYFNPAYIFKEELDADI